MSFSRRIARQAGSAAGWSRDHEWQDAITALGAWPDDHARPQCWRKGPLAALVGREPVAPEDLRWHISLQHRDRVPNWEELAATGHELRPGVVFVIGVPPRSWWLNIHPNVLHLWETSDANLIQQWQFERRGDRPT